MNLPEDIKYTKDHEWIRMDGDLAVVGVTDYAQGELGDVVFVEVDKVGEDIGAGESFGSIEAVKTVSDLFMPVSGTVEELNSALEDNPEAVNKDPYGEGWIVKIRPRDASEVEGLLSVAEYKQLTGA